MVIFEASIFHLLSPRSFACSSAWMSICNKSPRAFIPCLDLSSSCSNVERMFSQTFFSMCIHSNCAYFLSISNITNEKMLILFHPLRKLSLFSSSSLDPKDKLVVLPFLHCIVVNGPSIKNLAYHIRYYFILKVGHISLALIAAIKIFFRYRKSYDIIFWTTYMTCTLTL